MLCWVGPSVDSAHSLGYSCSQNCGGFLSRPWEALGSGAKGGQQSGPLAIQHTDSILPWMGRV